MKLYRVCDENEAKTILEGGDFSSLGRNYYGMFRNTFRYEFGKKYLHFFGKLGDIFFLRLCEGDHYCEYDIPDDLVPEPCVEEFVRLATFVDDELLEVYVIESSLIKKEYLTKMERINQYIDYEDYLTGDLPSMFDLVYEKGKGLNYEKKSHQDE